MKKPYAFCLALILFVSSVYPVLARDNLSWDFNGYLLGNYPLEVSSLSPVKAEVRQGVHGGKALCVSMNSAGAHSVSVPVALDFTASGDDVFYTLLDFSGWTYTEPAKGNTLLSFTLVGKNGERRSVSGVQEFSYWYAKGGAFVAEEGIGSVFLERGVNLDDYSVCLIGMPFSDFGVVQDEEFQMLEISVFSPGVQAGSEFWVGEISVNRSNAEVWPLRPEPATPVVPQEPSGTAEPFRKEVEQTERATPFHSKATAKENAGFTRAATAVLQEQTAGNSPAKTETRGVAGATVGESYGYEAPAADPVVWNDSSNPWIPAIFAFAGLCILVTAAAFQYNRVYRKQRKEERGKEPDERKKSEEGSAGKEETQDGKQEHRDV